MSNAILNINILVVDDYPTMRRIIKNLLSQLGFVNIYEAGNGEEAISQIKNGSFNLIISDWNMEPMNGLQLIQQIRTENIKCTNDNTKPIPFIMVTAESKTENVVEAKKAGVNNYIVKPFNAATLKQKLESVLGTF